MLQAVFKGLFVVAVFLLGMMFVLFKPNSPIASYVLETAVKVKQYVYPNPTYVQSRRNFEEKYTSDTNKICTSNGNNTYSFFVAGHTYGTPGSIYDGIYNQLLKNLSKVNECQSMRYGFFLGDIVSKSSNDEFEMFKISAQNINTRVKKYVIPGNHDVGIGKGNAKRDVFRQHFGKEYQYFEYDNDLFVLLDTNFDKWSVSQDQLSMLRELNLDKQAYDNIFVFTHQLIWIDKSKDMFGSVRPNSWEGYTGKTNFWEEVFPILSGSKAKLYVFSGDVGAFSNGSEFFYGEYMGADFFATGMGGGPRDNFLIVSVTGKHVDISLEMLD